MYHVIVAFAVAVDEEDGVVSLTLCGGRAGAYWMFLPVFLTEGEFLTSNKQAVIADVARVLKVFFLS